MKQLLRDKRGHGVMEATLLVPWILLLFAGTADFGAYGYALIHTQNARGRPRCRVRRDGTLTMWHSIVKAQRCAAGAVRLDVSGFRRLTYEEK